MRPDASAGEVRAAWRRAVSRWHPDRNPSPDATTRLQEINDALAELLHGTGAHGYSTFSGAEPILAGLDGTVFGREWPRGEPVPAGARVDLEIPLVPWLLDQAVTLGIALPDGVPTIVTLIHPRHFRHGSVLVFSRSALDPDGGMEDLVVTLHIAVPALETPMAREPMDRAVH